MSDDHGDTSPKSPIEAEPPTEEAPQVSGNQDLRDSETSEIGAINTETSELTPPDRQQKEMLDALNKFGHDETGRSDTIDDSSLPSGILDEVQNWTEREKLTNENCKRLWDYFHHEQYAEVGTRHLDRIIELDRARAGETARRRSELEATLVAKTQEMDDVHGEREARTTAIDSEAERSIQAAQPTIVLGLMVGLAGVVIIIVSTAGGLDGGLIVAGLAIVIGTALFVAGRVRVQNANEQSNSLKRAAEASFDEQRTKIGKDIEAIRRSVDETIEALSKRRRTEISHIREEYENLRSLIPPDPSETEVDSWVDQMKSDLVSEAYQRSGIHSSDALVHDPVVIWAPALFQDESVLDGRATDLIRLHPGRIELFRMGSSDGYPRFAVYYVQAILPTKGHVTIYSALLDAIGRSVCGELIDQYFYGDIVSMAAEAASRPLGGASEAARLSLDLSSGAGINIRLEDEGKLVELQAQEDERRKMARAKYLDKLKRLADEHREALESGYEESCSVIYVRFRELRKAIEALPEKMLKTARPIGVPDETVAALRNTIQNRKAATLDGLR